MQEKEMVLDVLSNTKSSLANYAKVISESANTTLRDTFKQMRDEAEKFQYELYKLASSKGYYPDPPEASMQDITHVKASLTQSATAKQGAGPIPSM